MREWINILSDNMSVLDKIRAEIVEEQSCWREDADTEWHECRRILRIIDKYREEQTDAT